MILLYYLFILTVVYVSTSVDAIRTRLRSSATQQTQLLAQANGGSCACPLEILDALQAAYPCLSDYCGASSSCDSSDNTLAPTPTSGPNPTPTSGPNPTPSSGPNPTPTSEPVIVPPSGTEHFGIYVPNWFVYRKHYMGINKLNENGTPVRAEDGSYEYQFWGATLKPVAPKYTHMYYAFWDLTKDCIVEDYDPDASWHGTFKDVSWIEVPNGSCNGLMNDLMSLKSEFPHLKLSISIGGWTCSRFFSACASTAEGRDTLYKSIAFRLTEMDPNWGKDNAIWNGLDLDWEFPESAAGLYPDHSENDYPNFIQLFTEIRTKAKAEGRTSLVLSSAAGVGDTLAKLVARPDLTKSFCDVQDHINIMEYDLHGKWDPTTGHNANFCEDTRPNNPNTKVNVKQTVEGLLNAGCSSQKIILGIPSYSHAWTTIPPGSLNNGLFSKATSDNWIGWGTFSDSDTALVPQGIVSYWDLKKTLQQNSDFQVYSMDCPADNGIVVPVKHVYSSSKQAFASYEDPETVEKKAQWAKIKNLGGIFFWDAQSDREGDILDAARKGFGVTKLNSATGTAKCFDSSKPDYSLDPLTGEPKKLLCQFTNNSAVITGAMNTCFLVKQHALTVCGGKPSKFIGAYHADNPSTCVHVCSDVWGAGTDMVYPNDTVFFACEGDTIPEAGTPQGETPGQNGTPGQDESPNGGQNRSPNGGQTSQTAVKTQTQTNGGGQILDCYDCTTCQKNTSLGDNGVSDAACAACIGVKDAWWPCTQGLCICVA